MSKLLINEYPIAVLPKLAKVIGLNEAIVLQQVHYWLENPKTGVWFGGHKWIHNTYAEWQENFPFWSVETVKRAIHSLEDVGLLISEQFAPNPFDKTKSYRVNYEQLASLDEVNLTPSITETTVSDTNNTSSGKNVPSDIPDEYPVEWQIGLGKEKIVMPDNKDNQYRDAANIIAMTFGTNSQLAFSIAYTFMKTRGIIIPTNKLKGNRTAVQNMIQMGVNVEHVEEATRLLMGNKKLTGIVDLFSIEKTASSLANPAPETYTGAIDGV